VMPTFSPAEATEAFQFELLIKIVAGKPAK
jgi:hypothetical protein